MVHPWVVGGGVGLQITECRYNILNKQLWTASKRWSPGLEVDNSLTTLHHKEPAYCKMLNRALKFDGFL
jgi:hypothetical protein